MCNKQLITAVLIGALVLFAAAPASVAADEGGILDDFQSDEDSSRIGMTIAAADGMVERISYWASSKNPLADNPEPDDAVAADAQELRDVFNNNSASIENYTNDRFAGNASEWDVVKLKHVRDGASTTQYLVSDVDSSGNFTNTSVTNSTDRTVDKTLVLEDYASHNAATELQYFVDNYVSKDKDISGEYLSRLASKYKGHTQLPSEVE